MRQVYPEDGGSMFLRKVSELVLDCKVSINSNQLMHISVFIKNTLKVYLKFLLPQNVSDHRGIHPQGAIIRS